MKFKENAKNDLQPFDMRRTSIISNYKTNFKCMAHPAFFMENHSFESNAYSFVSYLSLTLANKLKLNVLPKWY